MKKLKHIEQFDKVFEKMNRSDGLVQRRNINRESSEGVPKDNVEDKKPEEDVEDGDSKETRLTLMEEVLLLGLKDKEVNPELHINYDFDTNLNKN